LSVFGFVADLIVLVIVTEANFVEADLAGLMADVSLAFRASESPESASSLIGGVEVRVIAFFRKFPKYFRCPRRLRICSVFKKSASNARASCKCEIRLSIASISLVMVSSASERLSWSHYLKKINEV
jgi:hypothetical protein